MKQILLICSLAIAIIFKYWDVDFAHASEANKAWNDRVSLFKEMGANMRKLKRTQDTEIMVKAAELININSKKISEKRLWPKSSGGGETRAKIEIWKNFSDFEEKFKSLERASSNLIMVAKKGDLEISKDAFRTMAKTCSSCHRVYRAPKKW